MEVAVCVWGGTSHTKREADDIRTATSCRTHSVIDPSLCQYNSVVAGVREDSGIKGATGSYHHQYQKANSDVAQLAKFDAI